MQNVPVSRQGGLTLVELLVVIGLLAVIAAIAVPAFDETDEAPLDRAATEVAAALRFAQSEAIRTGSKYGVIGDTSTSTLRVYRLDETVNPPVVVYDAYDPFTKQLYSLSLPDSHSDLRLVSATFTFESVASPLWFVGFSGETGVPTYSDSGVLRMLESGFFRIELDDQARIISVAPTTGRVTVQ